MSGFQPDLFGETDAIEGAARNFLATPWTSLLGWWGHPDAIEAMVDHGGIKASKGDEYAYAIRPKGLHFEPVETWGGWSSRPSTHARQWPTCHEPGHEVVDHCSHVATRSGLAAQLRAERRYADREAR